MARLGIPLPRTLAGRVLKALWLRFLTRVRPLPSTPGDIDDGRLPGLAALVLALTLSEQVTFYLVAATFVHQAYRGTRCSAVVPR